MQQKRQQQQKNAGFGYLMATGNVNRFHKLKQQNLLYFVSQEKTDMTRFLLKRSGHIAFALVIHLILENRNVWSQQQNNNNKKKLYFDRNSLETKIIDCRRTLQCHSLSPVNTKS